LPDHRRPPLPHGQRRSPCHPGGQAGDQIGADRLRARSSRPDAGRDPEVGAPQLMDVTSQIIEAINGWLVSLSTNLLKPALAAAASNLSLVATGALIRLDNALITGLLGPDPAAGTFGQLAAMVQRPQTGDQVAGSLVALAAAVLAILLVALYIGRDLVLLV